MTDNLELLKKRLKRLKRKAQRQTPGSNSLAKTQELIEKTTQQITRLTP